MEDQRWSERRVKEWYAERPWFVGSNFIPSTAINQLEMWQAETFDPETIDRELGWAADLGFNGMRVYLHDLLWLKDAAGFKDRINQYLDISDKHGIKTMFVMFDDCWHDNPRLGKQPEPKPGIHNSGWLKGPGTKVLKDQSEWGRLEDYVTDIVTAFGSDERVILWDMYNEPANNFLVSLNLPAAVRSLKLLAQLIKHVLAPSPSEELLRQTFTWVRAAQPSQPLTAGLYYLKPSFGAKLNDVALKLSDVVSFHSYFKLEDTVEIVTKLQQEGRLIFCTEYLARGNDNTFETHLPYFKENKISCFNWGLVSGKTQTIYSWADYYPDGEEPPLWYHDVLRPDGSLYLEKEKSVIQGILKEPVLTGE